MTHQDVRILQWNSRSAISNKSNLLNLLNSNLISVAAISETWFTPSTHFNVGGYSCLRDDRPEGTGGGAALFIKKSLPFFPINNIKPPNADFQMVAAKIKDTSFISVYLPPTAHFNKQAWLQIVRQLSPPFFILGDFNAHSPVWGSAFSDRDGRSVMDFLDESNLFLLNDGSPTRISRPNTNPSAVDLSICSTSLASLSSWMVSPDPCSSDHFPINITYQTSFHPDKSHISTKIRTKLTKWDEFNSHMDKFLLNLPATDILSVKDEYNDFKKMLITAINKSNPPPKAKSLKKTPSNSLVG